MIVSILAHSGHGHPGLVDSWLHYLAEPEHALVLLAVVLIGVALLRAAYRRRSDRVRQ